MSEFFDRELSWIAFNRRVLSEAQNPEVPLLERFKFLAITASNFDEFFMVRVASLRRAIKNGDRAVGVSPYSPSEILQKVLAEYADFVAAQYTLLETELLPALGLHRIYLRRPGELGPEQRAFVKAFFDRELFNVLAPVKIEANRPLPFVGNLKLNLAFLLRPSESRDPEEEDKLVMLEVPAYLNRFLQVPDNGDSLSFVLIEDAIALFADRLFPGYQPLEVLTFRVSRDADIPVDEEKEEDFVEAMNRILQNRRHSKRVRVEISGTTPRIQARLVTLLEVDPEAVVPVPGPLNLKDFMSFSGLPGHEALKVPVWDSFRSLSDEEDLWETIRQEDQLLFHPYESFSPVVRLITEAAVDPQVLSIRMTLYRTSGDSPIVQALARAALEGKQVLVLVELKARFDEEQNLGWAQTLEKAGGVVVYGVEGLKVHSKALLIVRREPEGIRRYAHLGTGNYHDKTARLYTDLGLLTARPDLTAEVAQFFNAITGYSAVTGLRHLIMAPTHMKKKVLALIDGAAQQAGMGVPVTLTAKMNSLADGDVIEALYRASQAGADIRLNVRGICMLVPGKAFSARIQVVSIVDRFLEHSRIFHFRFGDRDEVYLASADWMYRNLERRVELMFPIHQKNLKERVITLLRAYFDDNTKAHDLGSDGVWRRRRPGEGQTPVRVQQRFHDEAEEKRRLRAQSQYTEIRPLPGKT